MLGSGSKSDYRCELRCDGRSLAVKNGNLALGIDCQNSALGPDQDDPELLPHFSPIYYISHPAVVTCHPLYPLSGGFPSPKATVQFNILKDAFSDALGKDLSLLNASFMGTVQWPLQQMPESQPTEQGVGAQPVLLYRGCTSISLKMSLLQEICGWIKFTRNFVIQA